MKYRIGQRFIHNGCGEEHILAQVDYGMCALIDLHTGNRISNPVKVVHAYFVTEEEFVKMCNDSIFTLTDNIGV